MTNSATHLSSDKSMTLLSRLLLSHRYDDNSSLSKTADIRYEVENLTREEFDDVLGLACSNHVVIRGINVFLGMMREVGDEVRIEWAESALSLERSRINTALSFLHSVCNAFEDEKHDVAVIKSLDHYPDLGSDLDLYTDANPHEVSRLMARRFHAEVAQPSWGDRLAHKANFIIPGLPEAVEVHMGRLGQTGEQVVIASHLLKRTRIAQISDYAFRVLSASDRLMISTLQRMYRHFYFRLCDIVDSAALIESGEVDFDGLQSLASMAGIWEGVATYLLIVSDYVERFKGSSIYLPQNVRSAARFGGDKVYYGHGFLRVPIMPQSVKLYGSQLANLLRKHELQSGARLSLLPWLATAAAIGKKITGSDKGVW